MSTSAENSLTFLTDVQTLCDRARQNIADAAVTKTYGGNVNQPIECYNPF